MTEAGPKLLRRTPDAPAESDPVDDVLKTSKKLAAARAMSTLAGTMDAESIKAENEGLKAKIEQQQLLDVASKGQDARESKDAWQEYILHQLEESQAVIRELADRLNQQQMSQMQEQVAILRQELQRITSAPAPEPKSVVESIQEAQALVALTTPPPAPTSSTDDPAFKAWEKKMDWEIERSRTELATDKEIRLRSLELERDMRLQEIAVKKEQAEQTVRFMNDTAPKIMGLLDQLMSKWNPGVAAAPSVAADAVQDAPAVAPLDPNDPNIGEMQCLRCQTMLRYLKKHPGVVCWKCGEAYSGDDSQPAGDQYASVVASPTSNGYHETADDEEE